MNTYHRRTAGGFALLSAIITMTVTSLLCGPAMSQTVEPPAVPSLAAPINLDFLTNIPTVTNFSQATLGLATGVKLKNGGAENLIKLDTYFSTNWMVSAEVENAPSSSVVDSLSLYGGYRLVWNNAEVYGELGARRNWSTDAAGTPPSFQGVALLGATWQPMTGGHVNLFSEVGISTAPRGSIFGQPPGFEARTGVKIFFGKH